MKQRLPRKLKKERNKLRFMGVPQICRGQLKGLSLNKWTWKLYHKVLALYINALYGIDSRPKNVYFEITEGTYKELIANLQYNM